MLAQTLRDIGYISSKDHPVLWIKVETKPDGTEYYEYVLVYVDDVIHLHHDPDTFMNRLAEVYRLNDGSVGNHTDILVLTLKTYNWMAFQ